MILTQAEDSWHWGRKRSYAVPYLENVSLSSDTKPATLACSLVFPAAHTWLTDCMPGSITTGLYASTRNSTARLALAGNEGLIPLKTKPLPFSQKKIEIRSPQSTVQQNRRHQVHMMGWNYLRRIPGRRKLRQIKKGQVSSSQYTGTYHFNKTYNT